MKNTHHDIVVLNKKGILVIEFTTGEKIILDLNCGGELTYADFIVQKDFARTKTKYLFENRRFKEDN